MKRIDQIWKQLEFSKEVLPGLYKLRFSETSKCDLFLGVKFPESYRILILKVPLIIGKEFNFRYEYRGMRFDKIYDPDDSHSILLNLVLIDRQFKDVFDTFVEDIVTSIVNETELKSILKEYSNRLIKWQSLFERFKSQGLSPEAQRGLFGELYFLRKFINSIEDLNYVVNTWTGADKEIRDFQSGSWAVEIKTTFGNNHQKVHISNERQLDTSNLDDLYLYHISLEQLHNSGETLNAIVDSVSEILKADMLALNQFKIKLYEVGYFDLHRNLYDNIGYHIRQDVFYKVENDFPRIEEKDIRNGVGDVKYSIIVSQCSPFVTDELTIFETLKPLY